MRPYNPIPITTLETERLLLRPSALLDAPRIQQLFDNYNLLKYLTSAVPWPYPATGAEDHLQTILPKVAAREMYAWSILEKADIEQGLIGLISVSPGAEDDSRGFWLGEPYWGRGYMSEVVFAVNDFAFGPLGMEEMFLNNAQPNVGSHRLKEKSGAQIVSIEDRDFIGGRFPGVHWSLTAEQWAAHRDNFLRR